jgi:acyl-coenzyme A thioesterase PaaI-like protein
VTVTDSTPSVDAAVAARVRASFARQGAMGTLGADLADVAAGRVAITLPIEPRLSQQDGFLHAGSSSPRSTALAATRR